VFFVISGIVIAYSARLSAPIDFIGSRFLRIYPTVWVCSTIVLIALLVVGVVVYFGAKYGGALASPIGLGWLA